MAKSQQLVPVIGARSRAQLDEALGALELTLTPELVAKVEAAVPAAEVAGSRYQAQQMQHLDSEK